MLRVVVVDDHPLFRYGLRDALGRFDDIEVVGEAETGRTAAAQAAKLRPDVVLMDLRMPDGDGIWATEEIRRGCPETQVLVLTAYCDVELFRRAAAAGAAGYVLKDITAENLAAAIRAVHRGSTMINPGLARQLLDEIAHGTGAVSRGNPRLTGREMEILVNVARGLSDKELATKLYLSESTVKSHMRDIYRKLDVRNRVQAAAYVIHSDLMTDNDLVVRHSGG